MRKSIASAAAAIACLALALGLLVVPAASAYQPPTPTPNPCAESDTAPDAGCEPVNCSLTGREQLTEYLCRDEEEVDPTPTPVFPTPGTPFIPDPTPTARPTATATPVPDEVEGVSQVPLATTGSNIDTPITIGALLIGVGGIVLFAARKRQDSIDSE